MLQQDQRMFAKRIVRGPLINSPVELNWFVVEATSLFSPEVYHVMKFKDGPLTKANTRAPQTETIDPINLAEPCNSFM